jgi:transcriptional regulator with XRE-family HTH domain
LTNFASYVKIRNERKELLAMLTELGKVLRKIRIDRQELLRDMAGTLGVSVAYLSAVETGKRNAPVAWTNKIIQAYRLNSDEAAQLRTAFDESQDELRISLQQITAQQRSTAISFAKALEGLSDEQLEKIMKVVQKGSKKE